MELFSSSSKDCFNDSSASELFFKIFCFSETRHNLFDLSPESFSEFTDATISEGAKISNNFPSSDHSFSKIF